MPKHDKDKTDEQIKRQRDAKKKKKDRKKPNNPTPSTGY